ncbi:hypothetical protein RHGRI_006534 [Rhododendron griersonianum]|uniref:AAA+ ATPase domain-containing protein n=1 Tax=Rhododendron griersonianum TaxID=479676 RepID=A0AAV6KUU0_9ERIC|nr:hypothetical protein RHGRI_006534 [Rhododendron griersonianum]
MAEAIPGKIGEVILGQVGDNLVAPIQHMCYFNSNITELETQLKGLKRTREDVQRGVVENRRKVRVVGRTVEAWLTIADEVTTEAEGIIQDKAKVKEGCLNGWCPNLKLRYSLSRKAVKKTNEVVDLMAKGVQYTQSSYSPPPPCLDTITNRDFMGFESRRHIMEEIIKALKHDEINLIGVCGMGGVGKTTLVKEVAKIAKEDNHFHEVAMAVVSQKPNLTNVQASIAEMLGLTNLHDKKNPIVRADLLRRRLLQDNKKVLIILDDIWEQFDLQDMGIPLEDADKNIKLLYTSRTQDLWRNLQTKKEIPLEVLLKDEAWQLFREKAGDSADAPDLQPIAKRIVNECGCLPLALVLIGCTLSKKSGGNHTKEIWEEMLDRLTRTSSTSANEQLSSRLALSYEYLEYEQAKRLFLLCCLFREDEEILIEDLAIYGLGLSLFDEINEMEKVRRRVLALVDDLKSSYLLLDGKNKEEECVKVHDVVRDMGISIASKNKFALVIHGELSEWPKKDTCEHYTCISLISTKTTELPKGLTCPNLEFLLLDCRKLKELPCDFFEGMGKLKVLVLKNFKGILALPPSLRNLHTLSLPYFNGNFENVSEFGGLFNLNTLSFRGSCMKELPKEIGELVNLRLLDLTDTLIKVERIPPGVISRLAHLEELYVLINSLRDVWEGDGNEEEGRNANLREFAFLSYLRNLEIFMNGHVLIPKFPIFEKLEIYKVVIVDGNCFSYEECIDDSGFIDEFGHINDADFKDFVKEKCERVLWVQTSIPIPSDRGGIDSLLRSSDWLCLREKGCNDLVRKLLLRDGVNGLQQKKVLKISGCDTPEWLVNTTNPVHLPTAPAPHVFPILKDLHLCGLVNLREICCGPVPAGSFGELTSIRVHECESLENLFRLEIVGCLTRLEELTIWDCDMMAEVFWKDQQEEVHVATNNRIVFPKLKSLKLMFLRSLVAFCRGIDQIDFPQLKRLVLYGPFHNNCNLSSNSEQNYNVGFLSIFPQKVCLPIYLFLIPFPFVSLPNLEILEVGDLENLEGLGHGSLSKLKEFSVSSCNKLLCVFPSRLLAMLQELQKVTVGFCGSLEVVFEVAELQNLERLGHGPLSVGSLSKLKEFSVSFCDKLLCVFPSRLLAMLQELQKVTVGFCDSLEVVFEVAELQNLERLGHGPLSVGSLSKLKEFSVHYCGKLLCVIPSQLVPMLRGLQELTVESCDSLEVVFELEGLESNDEPNPEILSQLKFVKLRKLPNLNCISKSDPMGFKYIHTLEISKCNSLSYVFAPTMTKSIPQLRELKISSCEMLARIVAEENGLGENSVDEVEFPQLERLELLDLPNIVSFFPNVNTTTMAKSTDHLHNPIQSQPLFNEKVAFPSLKYLGLSGLQNVNDLWGNELPTNSFSKLETLNVRGFANLRSMFHPSTVGGLANLLELVIIDCSKMEGVVYLEEETEDGQGRKVEKTLFPLLRKLQLSNLPNLVSFFPNVNTTTLAKSNDHLYNPMQPQPLFNEKVAIPSLEYMKLSGLQNVSDLWGSELPTSSFSKLKNLQVMGCTSLRNILCISLFGDLNNTTQGLQEVAQLLYTDYGVLAFGSNGTMTEWNWPSGKVTTTVLQPSGLVMTNGVTGVNLEEAVPCMALSKYGNNIISACGGAISLFDRCALEVRKMFMPRPPASTFLAFYPQDDDIIGIGMEDSTIRIYNHTVDEVKSELKGHEKRITGLAFSTNLNILVSSAADAQLCIWRIDTWEHLKSVSIQLPAGKACNGHTRVQFHLDQIRLLVSHETQLAIYDASEMERIRQWVPQDVLPAPISFAVYSCDSQLVYTSFCDGNIGVFDADSLTLACRIVPSIYLSPAMLSGGHTVYPRVVAAHPKMTNQFAIGLTNGVVVLKEPEESEGKWGLSPAVDHNGMLNDRTASSSNTSNHTPLQNGDGPTAGSMEKPKTLDDVTDKSKPWKVTENQCQLVVMPDSTDEAHKVARLLYTNGCEVLALGCNGALRRWRRYSSKNNQSGMRLLNSMRLVLKATASVFPLQWEPASGLAMTNDVTGVNLEEAVPCMALSKKYGYIISACGGAISFEDPSFKVKLELKGHEKRITGLAFSTNLNILVSSGADGQVLALFSFPNIPFGTCFVTDL